MYEVEEWAIGHVAERRLPSTEQRRQQGANVRLAELLETSVQFGGVTSSAQVDNGLVELLETGRHWCGALHGDNGVVQRRPCDVECNGGACVGAIQLAHIFYRQLFRCAVRR